MNPLIEGGKKVNLEQQELSLVEGRKEDHSFVH